MSLEERIFNLGYVLNDSIYEKAYNDEIYQIIILTKHKRKISEYYIYYNFGWFETQQQINDIQIAFNRLQRDIRELQND